MDRDVSRLKRKFVHGRVLACSLLLASRRFEAMQLARAKKERRKKEEVLKQQQKNCNIHFQDFEEQKKLQTISSDET